jgi:hypothetical protein
VAAPAGAGPRPDLLKACGSVHAKGEKVTVDIVAAHGKVSRSCSVARAVMGRFLRRAGISSNITRIRFGQKTFDCLVSVSDRESWAYHCLLGGDRFIDYGVGRRF